MPDSGRPTIVAGLFSRALDVGARCGLDRQQLLAELGIDATLLEDRDNRLPVETFARLWNVICPVNRAQFHLGIKVTPIAEARSGLLDVRKLIRAAERGAACRDDLSARWDHWAWVEMPLEEARERLGIPPLAAAPLAA